MVLLNPFLAGYIILIDDIVLAYLRKILAGFMVLPS